MSHELSWSKGRQYTGNRSVYIETSWTMHKSVIDFWVAKMRITTGTIMSIKDNNSCGEIGVFFQVMPNRVHCKIEVQFILRLSLWLWISSLKGRFWECFMKQLGHSYLKPCHEERNKSRVLCDKSSVLVGSFSVFSLPRNWPESMIIRLTLHPCLVNLQSFWCETLFSNMSLCHTMDHIVCSHPWTHVLPAVLGRSQ